MPKLYELTSEYDRLRELAEQAGTPEDEACFKDALAQVTDSIEDKADRIAALMSEWQADMDGLQHEEERLYARRKAIESNRARLGEYLLLELEGIGMEKIKGPRFTVRIQKNAPRVVIDEESKLPEEFWRTKREIAKDALRDVLKGGAAVPGARLESSRSLRIQ